MTNVVTNYFIAVMAGNAHRIATLDTGQQCTEIPPGGMVIFDGWADVAEG